MHKARTVIGYIIGIPSCLASLYMLYILFSLCCASYDKALFFILGPWGLCALAFFLIKAFWLADETKKSRLEKRIVALALLATAANFIFWSIRLCIDGFPRPVIITVVLLALGIVGISLADPRKT